MHQLRFGMFVGLALLSAASFGGEFDHWTEVNTWAGHYRESDSTSVFVGNGNPYTVLKSHGNFYGTAGAALGSSPESTYTDSQMSSTAKANADFGTLKAKANFSGTGYAIAAPYNFVTSGGLAQAQFSDLITFTGTGLHWVELMFSLTGSATSTSPVQAGASVDVNLGSTKYLDFDSTGPVSTSFFVQVPSGTQRRLTVTLSAYAQTRDVAWSPLTDLTGVGNADFFSTLKLTGVKGYNASSALIPVQVVGTSGTVYQAVPEPASMAALGGASLVLAMRRRRKR